MWNDTNSQWEPTAVPSAPVSSVPGRTGAVTLDYGDINNAAGKYLTYKPNNVACNNDELLTFDGTNWVCTSVSSALNGDYALSGANTDITSLGATTSITSTAALTLASSSNGDVALQPNGTGLVTTSSALRVTPTALPGTPAAGTIAFDSGSANAMKYYDGSAWQTLGTGTGSGDFMKNGFRCYDRRLRPAGTHNLVNIGTNVTGAAAITLASGGTSDLTLTSASGVLNSTTPLKITPAALPGTAAAGTIAFDSNASNALTYYDGAAWQTVNTSNATGDFMKDGSVAMTGDFNGGTKNLTNIGTNIDAAAGLTITTASNNNLNLAPNGTGLVTTSSALRVTPTSLPLTPAAGTIAFDSGSANAMKYYDGSAWVSIGSGTGDFLKNGSIAMTGNFDGGAHNLTNIGTNITGAAAVTLASGGTSDLTLTSASGVLNSTTPLKITPAALPGTAAAGTIAFDSNASNALTYYDGAAWQTVNTSNATGDFMKDGSVAMTGDFNGGAKNLTNIGTNIDAAAGLTITTASNNDLNLAPNGTGLVTLRVLCGSRRPHCP